MGGGGAVARLPGFYSTAAKQNLGNFGPLRLQDIAAVSWVIN